MYIYYSTMVQSSSLKSNASLVRVLGLALFVLVCTASVALGMDAAAAAAKKAEEGAQPALPEVERELSDLKLNEEETAMGEGEELPLSSGGVGAPLHEAGEHGEAAAVSASAAASAAAGEAAESCCGKMGVQKKDCCGKQPAAAAADAQKKDCCSGGGHTEGGNGHNHGHGNAHGGNHHQHDQHQQQHGKEGKAAKAEHSPKQ